MALSDIDQFYLAIRQNLGIAPSQCSFDFTKNRTYCCIWMPKIYYIFPCYARWLFPRTWIKHLLVCKWCGCFPVLALFEIRFVFFFTRGCRYKTKTVFLKEVQSNNLGRTCRDVVGRSTRSRSGNSPQQASSARDRPCQTGFWGHKAFVQGVGFEQKHDNLIIKSGLVCC